MYCGNNKTALASQRQISEALMRLIREKPYQQITISEICKTAGISRQTFYTLFTSRENVVVFTLEAQYCYHPESMENGRTEDDLKPIQKLCRGYSEYLLRNQALLETLVKNHIDYLLYDSIYDSLQSCNCFLSAVEPCARRYATSFYAGGISSVARQFVREGCGATADQLEALLIALFTGTLL